MHNNSPRQPSLPPGGRLGGGLLAHLSSTLRTVPSPGYAVALSGGADSVALLLLLCELGVTVRALHANFQLRGEESQRDEDFVRQLCARLNVPLEVRRFDTRAEAQRGESIEMAARRLRYDWFAESQWPVCVAHHADDNAETLLLNLLRGAGLRGLAAMPPVNARGIVRPLLGVRREELVAYLESRGQTWVDDSSNVDTAFRRNFVRHRALPLLREAYPAADATIARTQQHLREALPIYELGLQALDARFDWRRDGSDDSLSLPVLLEAADLGRTWLHERLAPLGFTARQLADMPTARTGALFASRTHLACTHRDRLIVAPLDTLYALPPGLQLPKGAAPLAPLPTLREWRVESGEWSVESGVWRVESGDDFRQTSPTGRTSPTLHRAALSTLHSPLSNLESPLNSQLSTLNTLDASAVVGPLRLVVPAPATRFVPLGMCGSRLLSDYLADRHLSRIDRLRTLVVEDDLGIVAVVGHTIAQRVAISPTTQRVVHLEIATKKAP